MIFKFPQLWCLAVALLVSQTPVHCDDKETTHTQAKRAKRDEVSTYGNDFTEHNHHGVPYLKLGSQNTWPVEDVTTPEDLPTSYRPNVFGKQYDDNLLALLQSFPQYETRNLSPRETRSKLRYFHSFVGKRDPEIDANDFHQFESDDDAIDDSIDLIRRRVPQFSHNFIGKRQQSNTDSYNLWKRMPVQLFARRAPHYSHSFVGKRSGSGDDYTGISNVFPGGLSHAYPYSFMETEPSSWPPASKQHLFEGNNFDNFRSESPLQFSDIPSAHYLVKRASDMEKRGPSFGHSFVGKRAPRFGHSFVGKRAPRFGHSFVGKREEDDAEVIENALLNNDFEDALTYTLIPEDSVVHNDAALDSDYSEDVEESPVKRQQRPNPNPLNFLGKRPSFTHSFVGKRAPGFGHSFVGKRAPGFGHSFVGKRAPGFGHSFVGKRAPGFGHSFVGKRAPGFGHSFVGKRAPGFGHSFVGKRAPGFGHSFVGKRAPGFGHSFVGKRAPGFGHSFVGKRAPGFGHSFVGKRPGFSHSFVGKRDEDSDYILSENPEDTIEFDSNEQENEEDVSGDILPELVIEAEQDGQNASSLKATVSESKIDPQRNASPEAVTSQELSTDMEKKAIRFGHSFVGKRAPGFGHSFVGKRAPGFGHSFVGKRAPGFGHSFVGKRAPGFGHSFVGKRAPRFGHSFVGKRAPSFGHSFVGKRALGFGHSFVGKRDDLPSVGDENLVDDNLTPGDAVELEELLQTDGNAKDQLGEAAYNENSNKTSDV